VVRDVLFTGKQLHVVFRNFNLPRIIAPTLRNSRIFPVQSYSCNNLTASQNSSPAFPCSEAILSAKCEINFDVHVFHLMKVPLSKLQPVYDINPHETAFGNFRFQIFIRSRITRTTSTLISFSALPLKSSSSSCKHRNTLAC
jgi:hypothetical protein